MKIHGVTADFIESARAVSPHNLSVERLVELKIHGLESAKDDETGFVESLEVHLIHKGPGGKGIGYLDDETMVVVAGGDKRVSEIVTVQINKIQHTPAGKIIFAELAETK